MPLQQKDHRDRLDNVVRAELVVVHTAIRVGFRQRENITSRIIVAMEISVFEGWNVGGWQAEINVEMSNMGAVSCSIAATTVIDGVRWEEKFSKAHKYFVCKTIRLKSRHSRLG